jgi:hypothetical protein
MRGQTLGHYEIGAQLGAGGMGVVYEATDSRLGRRVAIKLLHETSLSDPERLARFEREAKLLAALNHPNIAAIHAIEQVNGRTFLVLEYVPGETLAERIAQGPLPVRECLRQRRTMSGHPIGPEMGSTSCIICLIQRTEPTSGISNGTKKVSGSRMRSCRPLFMRARRNFRRTAGMSPMCPMSPVATKFMYGHFRAATASGPSPREVRRRFR